MQRIFNITQNIFGGTVTQNGNISPKEGSQKIDFATLTKPGRVYKIIPPESKESTPSPLRVFTLGCADGAIKAADRVAALMEELARGEEYHLILILGDNFDGKVKTPNSPTFLSHFHTIFAKYPTLKKIPKIAILGNHDVIDENGLLDPAMANAQVHHTYAKLVADAKGELAYAKNSDTDDIVYDLEKTNLLMPKNAEDEVVSIPYEAMTKFENTWYMFSIYNSVLWGDHIELFCSNTSTFVHESLARIPTFEEKDGQQIRIEGDTNPLNQAIWLDKRTNKSTALKKFLLGHHPPVVTKDKRTVRGASDHPDYVIDQDCRRLTQLGMADSKSNHTDMLRTNLLHAGDEKQGIPKGAGHAIKMYISAHHHAQLVANFGEYIQIVAGGMGGHKRLDPPPMQNRYDFKNYSSVATFMRNNGVTTLTIPQNDSTDIIINVYGLADEKLQLNILDNPHLCFNAKNLQQPLLKSEQSAEALKLSSMILSCCNKFYEYLADNPPVPWQMPGFMPYGGKIVDQVYEDVSFVDALHNACLSYEPVSFDKLTAYLCKVFSELETLAATRKQFLNNLYYQSFLKSYEQWFAIFDNALFTTYNVHYLEFIKNPTTLIKEEKPALESKSVEKLAAIDHPFKEQLEKKSSQLMEAKSLEFAAVDVMPVAQKQSLLSQQLKSAATKKEPLGTPQGKGLFSSFKSVIVDTARKRRSSGFKDLFSPQRSSPISIVKQEIRAQLESKDISLIAQTAPVTIGKRRQKSLSFLRFSCPPCFPASFEVNESGLEMMSSAVRSTSGNTLNGFFSSPRSCALEAKHQRVSSREILVKS